jgi:hypothetical protein
MRLLVSPLKGITNTFLNGQLVPQVRPIYGYQYKTPNLNEDRGFVVLVAGAWRKRQRKCWAFSDFPEENNCVHHQNALLQSRNRAFKFFPEPFLRAG